MTTKHLQNLSTEPDIRILCVELWCTLIEEELSYSIDDRKHHRIVENSYKQLMPLIVQNLLTCSDLDLTEWNLNVACTSAISVCSMYLKDSLVDVL